jgi:hypothetical protein
MLLAAIPLGIAVGLSFGMLGGGGSVLAIPVLVCVLGLSVHSATTASLAIVSAAALAGGLAHVRSGAVCWPHAVAFVAPAIGGILIGTAANRAVGANLLLALCALVMLAGAWATWHKERGPGETGEGTRRACPPLLKGRDALAGIAVGMLTGFLGVGGGFIIVPILVLALGFQTRSAIGTSLVIVSAISLIALGAHLALGNSLDAGVTAAMTAACVAGAVVGGRVAGRFSQAALARAFAVLVTGVAGYLLVATALLGGPPGA